MRIAIDARAADGPPTGIRWYVHTLIHALAASPEENRYLLLRHGASESPPLTPAPRFEDVKLPSPADMWMELHVDEVLAEWQADLFHSPFAPVPGVRPCPGVMTVHDVIPRVLPELVDGAFSRYFRDRMVPSFRHCERLIAVSQHTARDLTHLYGIHPERISIAATAAPPHHVQPIAPDQATEVLARLGISTPYLLYVGAIELRKNVSLLLDAYVLLREADPTAPPLVLVGAARDESDETVRALRRAAGRAPVVWLEYLTSDDLCAVYSQATAFIFPSLYEGFGLPVLEAMSHGVPVVCSYVSSLPEVVGDAGLLIDPYDAGQLASALRRLLDSPALRAELGGKAKARSGMFTLERMGRETLSAYLLAVERAGEG